MVVRASSRLHLVPKHVGTDGPNPYEEPHEKDLFPFAFLANHHLEAQILNHLVVIARRLSRSRQIIAHKN